MSVEEVGPPAVATDVVAELMNGILAASQRLDAEAVALILSRAVEAIGLPDCIDRVMLPAMSQIGSWWAAGQYTIPQEQMTTEAVRGWLDHRSTLVAVPSHPLPVVLACGPRDRHTIGAEALALLLRVQGWQCRVLGARVSTANLVTAVLAMTPAAVVVVSHLPANRRLAVDAVTGVHGEAITVFYAGNAFASRESREDVPGIYLGTSIQDACSLVCHVLEPAQ